MKHLLDSFWRAVAYCLMPRVIVLSLLPLVLMVALGMGLSYFFWEPAVAWVHNALNAWPWLTRFWTWLQGMFVADVRDMLAPLVLVLLVTPLVVLASLVMVAAFMSPALTRLVASRRFSALEQRHGASFFYSVLRSLGLTTLALVALLVSMPLWLIPPLVLVLPPLIWGWLTFKVMAFDALADHATAEERETLMKRHKMPLLGIGVLCGYLGAAPSIVWASGLLFAAAFFVLVPLAIWIYTVVFAFSALWFAHYSLDALAQLRAEREAANLNKPASDGPVIDVQASPVPPTLPPGSSSTIGSALPGAAPSSGPSASP